MKRRRLECAARWGCTVACAALLIAWPLSLRWYLRACLPPIADRQSSVTINNGSIYFGAVVVDEADGMPPEPCFQFGDNARFVRVRKLIPFYDEFLWGWALCIPIWMPFMVFLLGAGSLWQRRRLDHGVADSPTCPACGYSRAGLAPDAPCPECGSLPAPEGSG